MFNVKYRTWWFHLFFFLIFFTKRRQQNYGCCNNNNNSNNTDPVHQNNYQNNEKNWKKLLYYRLPTVLLIPALEIFRIEKVICIIIVAMQNFFFIVVHFRLFRPDQTSEVRLQINSFRNNFSTFACTFFFVSLHVSKFDKSQRKKEKPVEWMNCYFI